MARTTNEHNKQENNMLDINSTVPKSPKGNSQIQETPKSCPEDRNSLSATPTVISIDEEPIASSTPIQQYSPSVDLASVDQGIDSVDPQDHQKHVSGTSATEETPLLLGQSQGDLESWGAGNGQSLMRKRALSGMFVSALSSRVLWRFIGVVIAVVFVVMLILKMVSLETLINEAFETDIQSISVLEVHEDGIAIQVVATVKTEYSNISNQALRQLTKLFSVVVGGIVVAPRDLCQIFCSIDNSASYHVVDIFPPEFPIDLINHRISEIDFLSDVIFAEAGLDSIASLFLAHPHKDPLHLHFDMVMTPSVQVRGFSFTFGSVTIPHNLQVDLQSLELPLKVAEVYSDTEDSSLSLSIEVQIPPVPVAFTLSAIEWEVALESCEGTPVIIGQCNSSAVEFSPSSESIMRAHIELGKIDESLLRICNDGWSQFNRFVSQMSSKGILRAIMRAKKNKSNSSRLPRWLFQLLSEISSETELPVLQFPEMSVAELIRGGQLSSAKIKVGSSLENILMLTLDSQAHLDIESTLDNLQLQASVSNIVSRMDFSKCNSNMFSVVIPGSGQFALSPTNTTFSCLSWELLNVSVEVTGPELTGIMLDKLLNDFTIEFPSWNLQINSLHLEAPFVSANLTHLDINTTHSLPEIGMGVGVGTVANKTSLAEWLWKQMNISSEQILCVSSSPTHAKFFVDLEIFNPLNVSVEIPGDTLSFRLLYNNTSIGIIEVVDFNLRNSKKRVPLAAYFTLYYDSSFQRVLVEEFMSRVVSASSNIVFGISGSPGSASLNNAGLRKLLEEIKLEAIPLPEFRFPRQDAKGISSGNEVVGVVGNEPQKKQSPFLIDATFHVWSSDIELTVYNPLANMEIKARIMKCIATVKGDPLAHVETSELLIIPPGIYKTPRLPIKIAEGIGADLLRRAIGGGLAVDVLAEINVRVDQFPADIMYSGTGLTANVRL